MILSDFSYLLPNHHGRLGETWVKSQQRELEEERWFPRKVNLKGHGSRLGKSSSKEGLSPQAPRESRVLHGNGMDSREGHHV